MEDLPVLPGIVPGIEVRPKMFGTVKLDLVFPQAA